ncbi:MAG: hypothetical protein JST58_08110 [Bacteroidetes bacterium]|nr:hypothetical protein [Bacteroidota bacterium]
MKFQKQVQFSKYIKIEGQLKEFNFLKLNKNDFPSYTIDVSDERGRRFIFLLIQDGKEWKITGDDLPHWILAAKGLLQQEVELSQADSVS